MRAIFDQNISENRVGDEIEIQGSNFNHLVKVCRIRSGERVLILDGKGLIVECEVKEINRSHILLNVINHKRHQKQYELDIILGLPKKDYFEDCVRLATELGVNKIVPLITDYAQEFEFNIERLNRVIESALIQSNNPFWPIIDRPLSLDKFKQIKLNYKSIFIAHNTNESHQFLPQSIEFPAALVIGPEGGFSKEEIDYFLNDRNAKLISLPTPILKSATAIAAVCGSLLSRVSVNKG